MVGTSLQKTGSAYENALWWPQGESGGVAQVEWQNAAQESKLERQEESLRTDSILSICGEVHCRALGTPEGTSVPRSVI